MAHKQTKADRLLDKKIGSIYHRACSGIQIHMMDIPRVFTVAKDAAISAEKDGRDIDSSIESAIVGFVQTIRKN